jgi:hypothetical protein
VARHEGNVDASANATDGAVFGGCRDEMGDDGTKAALGRKPQTGVALKSALGIEGPREAREGPKGRGTDWAARRLGR